MSGITYLNIAPEIPNLIAIQIDGKLTVEALEPFYEKLEAAAASGEKIRLLIDLRSFDGFEIATVKQKLAHFKTLWKHVARIAYLVEGRWMTHYIELVDAVTPMTLKPFSHDNQALAIEWLGGNDETC